MTKQEIQAKIDALETRRDEIQEERRAISIQKSKALEERASEYFKDLLSQYSDLYIRKAYEGIYFQRPTEDKKWDKEIGHLSYREYTGQIEFNTYTTITTETWGFEKIVITGKIVEKILSDKTGVTAMLIDDDPKLEELDGTLSSEQHKLEREVREHHATLRRYKEIETLTQLQTEGVRFEKGKYMTLRWDWETHGVVGIKILKMTASGKSADIEIIIRHDYSEWDEEKNERVLKIGEERRQVVERVKIDNVLSVIEN